MRMVEYNGKNGMGCGTGRTEKREIKTAKRRSQKTGTLCQNRIMGLQYKKRY